MRGGIIITPPDQEVTLAELLNGGIWYSHGVRAQTMLGRGAPRLVHHPPLVATRMDVPSAILAKVGTVGEEEEGSVVSVP